MGGIDNPLNFLNNNSHLIRSMYRTCIRVHNPNIVQDMRAHRNGEHIEKKKVHI